MRFSFAFSASSSRSRLTSETDAPPYLLRHLKNVALLMPCFRSRSGTGTPLSYRRYRLLMQGDDASESAPFVRGGGPKISIRAS